MLEREPYIAATTPAITNKREELQILLISQSEEIRSVITVSVEAQLKGSSSERLGSFFSTDAAVDYLSTLHLARKVR